MNKLSVQHSPHITHRETTAGIMLDVIIALLPTTLAGFVLFGPRAVAVVLISVITAVVAEYACCKVMKKRNSLKNLSAVVTGLLLGLNMPPAIPLWMPAIGSAVAIVVVKMMFGGLGQNFANPAIVGRIVLMVSFPTAMTVWTPALQWLSDNDAVTVATPLANGAAKVSYMDLLLGLRGGCIGEVCCAAILLGGIYLICRRVISPTIPLAFIGTVFVMTALFGDDPLAAVLSGGLMLGAFFMATDYVTSPSRTFGKIIFGIFCGVVTVVIRRFGTLPEGVSYSILLGNLLVPHIDRLTRKKPFGWEGAKNG